MNDYFFAFFFILRKIDANYFRIIFVFFLMKEGNIYYILKTYSKGKERSVKEENINTQKMNTTFYITKKYIKEHQKQQL